MQPVRAYKGFIFNIALLQFHLKQADLSLVDTVNSEMMF